VELLADPNVWLAFATLAALEIVLGIDNVVFISILASRLPVEQQARARRLGLLLAMGLRILLLLAISWIMGLTAALFEVLGNEISGRDLILIGGGLFLIFKSTMEVHNSLEGGHEHGAGGAAAVTFGGVLVQIALIDIVFSLDSVITAVGLVDHVEVMIAAIVVAVGVMMLAAEGISAFIEEHPTLKMLALSFLLLIGVALIADGLDLHIPKGYIYFAMAFSIVVEMLNIRVRRARAKPVHLRKAQFGDIVPEADSWEDVR
jgi:predicted tellurium resistance membrane protein TerC